MGNKNKATLGTVLITGGSGLLGSRLTTMLLDKGYQVSHLTRSIESKSIIPQYKWDIKKQQLDDQAILEANHIIHLAGAGVADKKWSMDRKEELLKSRTESTSLLFKKLSSLNHSVETFTSASGNARYGLDTGDKLIDEQSDDGDDFLAQVTIAWEKEVDKIQEIEGIRVAKMRIGIVLSQLGGALPKISLPIKWGLGAPLGSGKQYMSWIHIDDLCNMFITSIENQTISGPYNAVASNPVTNKEMTKAIAKILKRPIILPPIPPFILRLMIGEMAGMVLGGNRVSNEKAKKTGFDFKYDNLNKALTDVFRRRM